MAATRASKLISLTNYATGGAFSLSTNKIISFKTSGSNTSITYFNQKGNVVTTLVTEAVATIHTATLSNTLYASQAITLDTGVEIYIMSDRIIYMDSYTATSAITYDAGVSSPAVYVITSPSLATLNTANGNTFTVTTQPTSNIPSKTRYINNLFVDSVVGEPFTAPSINFTTEVLTGTGAVSVIGSGYTAPTISITGGGGSGATGVVTTKVLTATVVNGGTGGTPGAVTLTGTTGTGTKFQATGTINGSGILTGALVVTIAGNYTVPVTNIAIEPCTATASLVGATVSVSLGLLAFNITANGTGYTSYPIFGVTDATGTLGAVTAAVGVESPLTIVDGGLNLNVAPTLTFSATTGTLATATATITNPPGSITSTTLTNAGLYLKGTDTYPTLTVVTTSSGGSIITYDQKKTEFIGLQVEDTVADLTTAINAL